MIEHCVFLSLEPDLPDSDIPQVMAELGGLVGRVPGLLAFRHGPNRDFEAKSGAYEYGFVVTFADRAAHLAYEAHPDHQAAGARLVAACRGGHGGIMVVDLEVAG